MYLETVCSFLKINKIQKFYGGLCKITVHIVHPVYLSNRKRKLESFELRLENVCSSYVSDSWSRFMT